MPTRGRQIGIGVAVLATLVLIGGCVFPTYDQSKLKAIRAESMALMAAFPIDPSKRSADVPENRWPPAIAGLRPEHVTVHGWGVDIVIKPYFDGGWGYEIPRTDERDLPMPPGCYSEPGPGVFWHGPC